MDLLLLPLSQIPQALGFAAALVRRVEWRDQPFRGAPINTENKYTPLTSSPNSC